MDSDKISTFMSVTSADAERARAYLEASGGDLDAAVATYFAAAEDNEADDAAAAGAGFSSNSEGGLPPPPTQQPQAAATAAGRQKPPPQQPQSRFVTMDALRSQHGGRGHGSDGSDDEDSDEGAQAFYVGGSERGGGGQQVLGPPSGRPDAGRIATSLFASARRHGATEVGPDDPAAAGGGGGGFAAFAGRGQRLDQQQQQPPSSSAAEQEGGSEAAAPLRQQPPVCRVLKLWSNGVSIDDGPLRAFEEPGTRELLRAVAQGRVPPELSADVRGARVDVQLEDHRDTEFRAGSGGASSGRFRAFAGSGLVLGSPAPAAVTAEAAAPPPEAAAAADAAASAGGAAAVPVNPDEPTTNLNVRLPSGGRPLSVTLNHRRHTVSDLRRFVCAERPELASASFVFLTTFPTAEIADESQSLEAAGLVNAAVVVRVKQ